MKVLVQFFCCLAFFVTQLALAGSAQELLSDCRSIAQADVSAEGIRFKETFESGVCWGTFSTIQKIINHVDETKHPIYGICAPSASRLSQLVVIFVSYAEKNPQLLHKEGISIAINSLQAAFPCNSRKLK
ncbi:MAG: hypothetical protein RL571_2822 [Pseudomonadota bacterium]|jgi:hypothetical protein